MIIGAALAAPFLCRKEYMCSVCVRIKKITVPVMYRTQGEERCTSAMLISSQVTLMPESLL